MQRRRFLQLALAAPVTALASGCGGGWNLGFGPIRGGGGGTTGSLTLGRMAATVDHGSLIGTLPTYTALQVATAFGSESPAASGAASVQVIQAETTLGFVTEASGAILYYGWLSGTQTALSAASTAEVLLYYALAGYLLPAEIQERVRAIIAASDSVRLRIGPAVASFLAANPKRLSGDTTSLLGLVATEAESLLPAVSAATRGVIIQTPGLRSGVEVAQSKEPNAVFAQNKYLRRAMLVVNQIGYTDSKNVPIDQLVAPRVPLQLSLSEIPVPKSYDSFANTISGWIEAYYSNKTFDDGSIDAGFFSSASDVVGLKVNPDGALRTKYRAYVLMPGSVPGNEEHLAELLPAQREYVEGVNLKNLYLRLFFEDLLAPFVLSFVAGKLAGDKELIKGLTEELLKAVREVLPGQLELVAGGRRKPLDVFIVLVKSMTIDPATGATSGSFQKIVGTTMQFLFKQLTGNGPELFAKNVTEGININGTIVPGVGRLVAMLEATDKLLDSVNRSRLFVDSTISKKLEFWDIEVDNFKVELTPAESVVVQGDGVVELKVNLRDAKAGEGQFFSYTWSCSSGRLTDGLQGNGKRIEASTAASVSYHAEGAVGETDTVTVQVTLRGPGSKDSLVLGTAEAKVNVVGLTVTPATTTLKNQETVALTGNLAGLRPLKAGETLEYRWLTTRNAGELLGSPDGGLSVPVEGTTRVTYRADVAKEGTDTVTFEVALAGTSIRLKRTASVAVGKPQDKVLPVIQGVFFDATGSTATAGLVVKCATFKIDPAAQSYSVSIASGATTTWRIQAKDVAATASGVDTTTFGIDKTWESGFTFPGMTKNYQIFYRLEDTIVAMGPTQHWGPNLFFKTRQQAVDSLNASNASFEISKAVAHY
ncbi:hypothetical protein [Armatimonas rosea]|uniref:Ethanolamine utilization microcompartment shell protein EutS n=1 Tax=Armatimonas rosea TaxID=685828 RepID=A0A7W9W442_ARMRO|nr:hypothetical protein [Armatimonas rosea]MBB6049054.1 ethanolamine utilization microcompartment shell protein EutS [Armatimonas rosea]